MAGAPWLALLFLGRAIAGITGASQAVASAYIADVTPEMSAHTDSDSSMPAKVSVSSPGRCWAALGGILGSRPVHRSGPAECHYLPRDLESIARTSPRSAARTLDPALQSLRRIPMGVFHARPALAAVDLHRHLADGQVGGTHLDHLRRGSLWLVALLVGTSLACFGLLHAFAQAFIAGPLTERWGERFAILTGVVTDTLASVLIAFANRGWMPFALMPLFCLGAIGLPALQSLLAKRVDADAQGKLQGVLASLLSLTSIVGPVAVSGVYFATRASFPGLVWLAAAALYLFTLPILVNLRRNARSATAQGPAG